jgi:gamma-glutamyltranspeptidase/glutathione hydrolase
MKVSSMKIQMVMLGLALHVVPVQAAEQGPKRIVHAKTAMAASGDAQVTAAMVKVMKNGGNAMDAVLTAVPLQTVIQPQMVTLAGGMSLLYYEAKTGKYFHLDAELDHTKDATTAAGWISYTAAGGDRLPDTSGKRIGVPGMVAGMDAAAARFGTLRWASYFQPAIELAEGGFPMYSFLYGEMAGLALPRLAAYPSGRAEFLQQGYVPPVGTIMRRPNLAATMRHIAAEGPGYAYTGQWARNFVDAVRRTGGGISLEEMAEYKPRWGEPTRSTFKKWEIIGAPPPSTAGVLVGMTLNILEAYGLDKHARYTESAETLEMLRRAFAFAEAATDEMVRDPLSYEVPTDQLLSKDYARTLYSLAASSMPKALPAAVSGGVSRASGMELAARFLPDDPHVPDTDHIVAVDKDGNVASLTHSVYGSTFGTGLVVDGIVANSGNTFPGTTKGAGRRVVSSFPPTIVARDGKPELTLGSPGLAARAVAFALINLLGYDMSLENAIDAPRFYGAQNGTTMLIESRFPPALIEELRSRYSVVTAPAPPHYSGMGSVQAIQRRPDGSLIGIADPRRVGAAAGY